MKAAFAQLMKDRGACVESVQWVESQTDIEALTACDNVEWWVALISIALKQGTLPYDDAVSLLSAVAAKAKPVLHSSVYASTAQAIANAAGLSGYNPRIKAAIGAVTYAVRNAPSMKSAIIDMIRNVVTPMSVIETPTVVDEPKKARRRTTT